MPHILLPRLCTVARALLLGATIFVLPPAACAQAPTGGTRTDTVRIALLVPGTPGPAATQVIRGATMSVEESARVAALLGHVIVLDTVGQASGVSSSPAARFIIAAGDSLPALPNAILIDAGCALPPRAPLAFSLCDAGAVAAGDSVVSWDPGLEKFGGSQLNARFQARWNAPMDEAGWRGWLAAKIAWESALRGPRDAVAMARWLASPAARFDGHQGIPLSFDTSRRLRHPRYRIIHRGTTRALEPIP